MKLNISIARTYALPIVSGILLCTSYIPFPPWAAFFGLVPMWLFWSKNRNYKSVFIGGWVTQFVYSLVGSHWVAYTVAEFGQLPWYVGGIALLAFCSLAHLHYPISGWLWLLINKKFKLSKVQSLLLIPVTFLLVESLYPFLFFWHFGYIWIWNQFPGMQLAEWVGFYGLNTLTIFINGAILFGMVQYTSWKPRLKVFFTCFALLIAVNILGALVKPQSNPQEKNLKVIAIQGNIGNLAKIQAEHGRGQARGVSLDIFLNLSRKAIAKYPEAKLLVWPETAFQETISKSYRGPLFRKLSQFLKTNDIDLLTGAYFKKANDHRPYNGIFLIDRTGRIQGLYNKTHLLAFGEYFPGSRIFPTLLDWFPMVSDFGRGDGPQPFFYNDLSMGGQICYEGLFDTFSTELQNKGAQVFFNMTNDSWFGYPFEPLQHMYTTLARAIENRRSLLRITNTGITSAITSNGDILQQSPHNQQWYGYYELPYSENPPSTFYRHLAGRWPFLFLFLIFIILFGGRIVRPR